MWPLSWPWGRVAALVRSCSIKTIQYRLNKPNNKTIMLIKPMFHCLSAKNTDVNLSVNMNDEFIHVSLVSPTTRNEDQDHEYLLQVPPKLDIQEPKHSPQIKLNILMVMFHSTSTVHFKRKMPKSHSFLAKSLTTIFMPGYSTVDESTKSQLAALLSGTSPQKLGSVPLDSLPWLFKVAKDNGYVTLFSDDKPYATDYTDTLTGFQTNPPDHYATPFWSAVYRYGHGFFNRLIPKSDQYQSYPAASPEILQRTVWRTWVFIAYSDERWLYTTNSRYVLFWT